MSSELRIAASRANGAKSRGPITPEGKLASSRNSLRHGLRSQTVLLDDESSEAFTELLAAMKEEHQAETPTEQSLIETMAVARWRQRRVWSMETAGLAHEIRHPEFLDGEDTATLAFIAFRKLTDETRALELLGRYEARYDRQFRGALKTLLTLRAEQKRAIAPAGKALKPPAEPEQKGPCKLFWRDDAGLHLAADPENPDQGILWNYLTNEQLRQQEPELHDSEPEMQQNDEPASDLGSLGNSAFPSESFVPPASSANVPKHERETNDLPAPNHPHLQQPTPFPGPDGARPDPSATDAAQVGGDDSMEVGHRHPRLPVETPEFNE